MASLPPSYDHPSSGSTQEPRAQNTRYHPFQAAVSRIRNAPRNGSNNSHNVVASPTRLTFPAPPPTETRPSSQLPSGRNGNTHPIESTAANRGDAIFQSPYEAGLKNSPDHPDHPPLYRDSFAQYAANSGSSWTSGGGGGAGPMHVDTVDSHDVEYNPTDYDGPVSHLGARYHSFLEQDGHSRMDPGPISAIGYNGDQVMNQQGSNNDQFLPQFNAERQALFDSGSPYARVGSIGINSFSPRRISAGSRVSSVGGLDIKRPRSRASSTREAFEKLGFDPVEAFGKPGFNPVDSDLIWRNQQQPPNQQGMEKSPPQFLIPNERPSALQIPSFRAQGSLTRGASTGGLGISAPGITILPTTPVSGGAGESNVSFETILENLNAQREINTQNPYQQQQQPQQHQPQFNQNAAAELMQGRQIPPNFPTNITPAVALQLQKITNGIGPGQSQLQRPSVSNLANILQQSSANLGNLLRQSSANYTYFEQRMNNTEEQAKLAVQSGNVMQMRQARDAAVELQKASNEERVRWMGVFPVGGANGATEHVAKQAQSWFSRYHRLYERAQNIVKSLEGRIQNIQQQQQQQAQARQQTQAQQQHQNANMLSGDFSSDGRASVPYMNLLPQRIGFDDSIPVPPSPAVSNLESVTNVCAAADAQQSMEPTLEELMRNHSPSNLSTLVTIPARSYAHGGLADVYAGTFNGIQVAVKVLRIRKSRRDGARDLEASNERRIRREMHVWSALKHRNICEFLGYSNDLSDYPAMVSTWCEHGTAAEYLEGRELSIKDRLRLAQDVGDGLGYLHRLKIVHGDLKPNNVLVDDEGVAKLCDFGLVRLLDWEGPAGMTTTSPYTGTERYKAPELFMSSENRHPVATLEGDVYSMGCIMLEFIEGVYPFQRFKQTYQLHKAIMEGHAPSLRRETTHALFGLTDYLWNLLDACWGDCSARPNAAVIIDTLDAFAGGLSQGNT